MNGVSVIGILIAEVFSATGVDAVVGLWRSTAAITSLLVKPESTGNEFAIGSTFNLYGIKSA